MRNLVKWLLILGALAGMSLRASGASLPMPCQQAVCQAGPCEEVVCCDQDHQHHSGAEEKSCSTAAEDSGNHDDPGAPHDHDHHHHHLCCGSGSLMADPLASVALRCPASLWLGMQWTDSTAPDSPVFDLDKPPLI